MTDRPKNLGALRESGYRSKSVRDELRANVIESLRERRTLFPGIIGYDETVVPMLVNAILSRHDILLLGLRGQAKSRLLRALTRHLDEWTPALAGTPLREDPLAPISGEGRRLVERAGDDAPIEWMHRDDRYQEKLATPDVSMADLIGDVDPIRASRERLDLSDERVIHFGLLPRANRGLFCINELPDLQARIQVGLLNVLEERDVQIRGFPVRLGLDVVMLFTANPEDYTNRGSIITPLKDRIGSQILTHYPRDIEHAVAITSQEADVRRTLDPIVPSFLREVVEEIAIEARRSEHVDQTSGVSARLPISALEILVSNVERRALATGDREPEPRLCDLFALVPAVTGKVELVYEGEQEGASIVAERLIGKAIRSVFRRHFPPIHRERRPRSGARNAGASEGGAAPSGQQPDEPLYQTVQGWFAQGNSIEVNDFGPAAEERKRLVAVDGLEKLTRKHLEVRTDGELLAGMELVLEGMHQHSMLAKEGLYGAVTYGDMISRMMQDL